jgi:hypothetical protein
MNLSAESRDRCKPAGEHERKAPLELRAELAVSLPPPALTGLSGRMAELGGTAGSLSRPFAGRDFLF